LNVVLPTGRTKGTLELERSANHRYCYVVKSTDKKSKPVWEVNMAEKGMTLVSRYRGGTQPPPFSLTISQKANHATLLGLMNQDGSMQLPAILHLPDQGSFRISSGDRGSLGYEAAHGEVKITFAGATRENPVRKYRCEVVAIYPKVSGVAGDAQFDGFRRNWLNILQISPQWRTLANHATSDTCAFCYYEYADIAWRTPPLANGVTALDIVRQSLDKIINGANAYGMPGHGAFPTYAADTLPSLLIAAHDCAEGRQSRRWLGTNYAKFKSWTDTMLATDRNGDGLVKYVLSGNSGSWPLKLKYRPANWWDTIGFGNEDAYANALAYRALRGMEDLAQQSNHPDDRARYHAAADKLSAVYFKTFYNPATGVLAGWRSSDGQLHDYYFPWVNGIAIHYGLVPKKEANAIMDRLLEKMKEAGYARFDLGLPGNLIPVARKDYVDHNRRFGGGEKEDNSDGFQIYENGAATACFAYFTLAALYDLDRIEDGDRILFPMLGAFEKGDFQGFGANGMSRDWKAWDGACSGYEGFLVDNYYALLSVLDREAALKRRGHSR
ncbi:MAG TPA: hypothetical protein VFC07_02540, partial [Verrucomicrobiae bacterium]|nr:hypothetical protein [Verrucomicrobiae bacterium]